MSLPILQVHHEASNEDLLRYYHRAELHWSRHLGEETSLDAGTAITNPDLASVHDANLVFDLHVPQSMTAADVVAQVDEHFAEQRTHCARWIMAPTSDQQQQRQLHDYLLASGFQTRTHDVMYLAEKPALKVAEPAGLKIIPARASFRHFRQLAEESAQAWNEPQVADASMLHLDDPHTDALLALKDGVAAASVAVLAVGEIGAIMDLFVSKPFRNQGIGRTMMSRAMEICARSLFKHVFLSVDPGNAPAQALYSTFGFRGIGAFITHYRPSSI